MSPTGQSHWSPYHHPSPFLAAAACWYFSLYLDTFWLKPKYLESRYKHGVSDVGYWRHLIIIYLPVSRLERAAPWLVSLPDQSPSVWLWTYSRGLAGHKTQYNGLSSVQHIGIWPTVQSRNNYCISFGFISNCRDISLLLLAVLIENKY